MRSSRVVLAAAMLSVLLVGGCTSSSGNKTSTGPNEPGASASVVLITPSPVSIRIAGTVKLTATAYDANNNALSNVSVTWASSNANIATVSNGVVTGVATGTDTITATSGTVAGKAVVQVSSVPVASVAISPSSTTIQFPNTVQLKATVTDSLGDGVNNAVIGWSSMPAGRVSNTGLVTPDASDTASGIKVAATVSNITAQATITVKPAAKSQAPTGETFVFDKDTLVPFGVPYDISKHVRWIITNASGDSVGFTTLASVSAVTYYPTIGSSNPGRCNVLAGTFLAYCPDGGFPSGAGASYFTSNGYWSVTVNPKSVSGVKPGHNTVFWYVNSNLTGSKRLTFAGPAPKTYTGQAVATSSGAQDTVTVGETQSFAVQTSDGLTVGTSTVATLGPASGIVYGQGSTGNGLLCNDHDFHICPGGPAPCAVLQPGGAQTPASISCSLVAGVWYDVVVPLNPSPFNGISNPTYQGVDTVNVVGPPALYVNFSPYGAGRIPVGVDTLEVDTASSRGGTAAVAASAVTWPPNDTAYTLAPVGSSQPTKELLSALKQYDGSQDPNANFCPSINWGTNISVSQCYDLRIGYGPALERVRSQPTRVYIKQNGRTIQIPMLQKRKAS